MFEMIGDIVKWLGVAGGIVSTVFLLYDRLLHGKPFAYLVTSDYRVALHIHNLAKETIIIDDAFVTPKHMELLNASDLQSHQADIAKALYSSDTAPSKIYLILKPETERTIRLTHIYDENVSDKEHVKFVMIWRNTRKLFLLKRRLVVRARVGDIRAMREAAIARKV